MAAGMDQVKALFERGSRYQGEKLVTMGVCIVIFVGSAVWAFSGEDKTNALGAEYGYNTIEALNDKLFFLENSGGDWTNVRIVINKKYLYKKDLFEAGGRATLRPEDFEYYYYIPRAWGRESWESLTKAEKPPRFADPKMNIKLVEVRADQGRIDIPLDK